MPLGNLSAFTAYINEFGDGSIGTNTDGFVAAPYSATSMSTFGSVVESGGVATLTPGTSGNWASTGIRDTNVFTSATDPYDLNTPVTFSWTLGGIGITTERTNNDGTTNLTHRDARFHLGVNNPSHADNAWTNTGGGVYANVLFNLNGGTPAAAHVNLYSKAAGPTSSDGTWLGSFDIPFASWDWTSTDPSDFATFSITVNRSTGFSLTNSVTSSSLSRLWTDTATGFTGNYPAQFAGGFRATTMFQDQLNANSTGRITRFAVSVPEPSRSTLLACGLGALILRRRRS